MAALMEMSTACQNDNWLHLWKFKKFQKFQSSKIKKITKFKMEKDKRKFGFFSADAYPSSKSSATAQRSKVQSAD